VPWARVVETAMALRDHLAELELATFARVTGGKGVHVVAPLVRRAGWDELRAFSKGIAQSFARAAPDHYTAVMSKAKRKGKIYIDWVRNTREATAIASYSTRARPGAPVAVPVTWEELETSRAPRSRGAWPAPIRGPTSRPRAARSRAPRSLALASDPARRGPGTSLALTRPASASSPVRPYEASTRAIRRTYNRG
jgi:hypothetical protein